MVIKQQLQITNFVASLDKQVTLQLQHGVVQLVRSDRGDLIFSNLLLSIQSVCASFANQHSLSFSVR